MLKGYIINTQICFYWRKLNYNSQLKKATQKREAFVKSTYHAKLLIKYYLAVSASFLKGIFAKNQYFSKIDIYYAVENES